MMYVISYQISIFLFLTSLSNSLSEIDNLTISNAVGVLPSAPTIFIKLDGTNGYPVLAIDSPTTFAISTFICIAGSS